MNINHRPWDSVDRERIRKIAAEMEGVKDSEITDEAARILNGDNCMMDENERPKIGVVKRLPLLGVPGAVALASFDHLVQDADGSVEGGTAQVRVICGKRVPLIIAYEGVDEKFLEHEKIHLCQFMMPAWPTVPDMKDLAGTDLENPAKTDYLYEVAARICYRVIFELEAYRFSEKSIDDSAVCDEILTSSGDSAKPYQHIEGWQDDLEMDLGFEVTDFLEALLGRFCEQTERGLPWISELVRNSSHSSWLEALQVQHAKVLAELDRDPDWSECVDDDRSGRD